MEEFRVNSPLRVLHLEDNPADRLLVAEKLAAEGLVCKLVHVNAREQFEAALERSRFDLIVSDFTLPSYDGMAALTAARRLQPETPFLFVSGTIGEERAVEGLKFGATDFVLKAHLDRLGPAVRRALREAHERQERQRAEEQVRLQGRALEAAANGIIITDRLGRILFANAAFCAMTGYTPEEVMGETPRLFKSGKHDPAFHRELWDTILAGRVWHGEVTNRRKNGTLYEEEMTITPVRADDGGITHFIAVKQDTSQRKQLEEQLRQSQKMEAIGRLAGGVAHDFNNVLAVIRGNAELVLMDATQFSTEARECLKQITAASERAANLTRQLLAFGRKQTMRFAPLNLNDVIEDLTKMLNRIIGEDIRLQCAFDPRLPFVQADAGMMEQVLMNLTINARDAMPRGGHLRIATERVCLDEGYTHSHSEARAGDFVCLVVSDTGGGIPPEHLPRIFEPFFTTKEAGKGTGLGLATVYGIVKQHKGWLEVFSQLDAGTTFKIFLPVVPSPPMTMGAQPAKGKLPGGTENILLVEDDVAVRLLTRRILETHGYHVWEAASGREALEVWKNLSAKIDLLLTDLIMPDGVTGRELAEQLSARTPTLKIICVSGYNLDVVGRDTSFLRRTRHNFLQKPCSSDVLLNTVRRYLDEKQTPAHAGTERNM